MTEILENDRNPRFSEAKTGNQAATEGDSDYSPSSPAAEMGLRCPIMGGGECLGNRCGLLFDAERPGKFAETGCPVAYNLPYAYDLFAELHFFRVAYENVNRDSIRRQRDGTVKDDGQLMRWEAYEAGLHGKEDADGCAETD